MRSFVYAGDDIIALSGFSAAAWRVAPRDWYIGWSEEKREENFHLVANNTRFLILPWVTSKNLASKILSLLASRIGDDWHSRYRYRPALIETFVEKNRFAGPYKTGVAAATRQHGLTIVELEEWKDRSQLGAENTLRARPKNEEALSSDYQIVRSG